MTDMHRGQLQGSRRACSTLARNCEFFQTSVAAGLRKPTPEEATAIVESLLVEEQSQPIVTIATAPGSSRDQPAWDGHDPYAFIDSMSPSGRPAESSKLDTYLRSASSPEGCLSFWEKNGLEHPRLSRLAAICFGVPASLGSVERLFYSSGALQRARRASLQPKTVEQLVLVSEHTGIRKKREAAESGTGTIILHFLR
ncbi:hypothetical protein V5799_019592 [Amblyomma americanum]|uniref:HAT C-terminal dimerisation domain-containing protein n=1 Tax=Amblyomma americanum TaxID=6943 RepID=A0AAQ4EW34_AMBAM